METTELGARPEQEPVIAAQTRFSGGAVFGGVVVALASLILLGLFGLVVGGAVEPDLGVARHVGFAAALWALFSLVVGCGAGSLVAGRLSGVIRPLDGLLHGAVVFATTLLILLAIATFAQATTLGVPSTIADAVRTEGSLPAETTPIIGRSLWALLSCASALVFSLGLGATGAARSTRSARPRREPARVVPAH